VVNYNITVLELTSLALYHQNLLSFDIINTVNNPLRVWHNSRSIQHRNVSSSNLNCMMKSVEYFLWYTGHVAVQL